MKITQITLCTIFTLFVSLFCLPQQASASDDGSRLWLRFTGGAQAAITTSSNATGPTATLARQELTANWQGGAIHLQLNTTTTDLKDGYKIATQDTKITLSADREIGLLYGAYHLLRLQQTNSDVSRLDIEEIPRYAHRMLNHWDNPGGTIERGYAGRSIWQWGELPNTVSDRYKAYARANASIGINAVVLNNVNASANLLKADYLSKIKILADLFRPYGIKVYLSLNFASPKTIGGLSTADPFNAEVIKWWEDKMDEIYTLIPDFGGFLVKANSEGQPGPQDYGRSHADGANMLAKAIKPHQGLIIWRAFVYGNQSAERSAQAYLEFKPLDGQFDDNVVLQIKNGPLDFQPHEPFSALFGAMKNTPLALEVQITQEYLGGANHLTFLAPMWKDCLDSDTYQNGEGSSVARKIEESSLIAGVANIGEDANWCGHDLAQANWYAFGRLAWNPALSSEEIAHEWIGQTFGNDPTVVTTLSRMMLDSWRAEASFRAPFGLPFQASTGHHYGPLPWSRTAFHGANATTLGVSRTADQYNEPLAATYKTLATCPDDFLLWFHPVSWDYRMKDGQTMWEALCFEYEDGVNKTAGFRDAWKGLETLIDDSRYERILTKLELQAEEAIWWKDACLLYFQTFHQKPFPAGISAPAYDLDALKAVKFSTDDLFGCPGVQEVYNNVVYKKKEFATEINYTHLIVNNDFDLAPDANCNPVAVTSGIDGWSNNAWRPTSSSCVGKQFYGWTHDPAILGSSVSQGINTEGGNKSGNWVCWVGGNAGSTTVETAIEFSQTIDSKDLIPGRYKVQCLMAIGSTKKFNQRLFANNNAQYFGKATDYVHNIVESENYTFAGHTDYSETQMKEMTVYVTIGKGESLTLGIRTSNKQSDGTLKTQQSPMFRIDYFRLYLVEAAGSDASLKEIKINGKLLENFSPEVTNYSFVFSGERPTIEVVANDAEAKVGEVIYPTLFPGEASIEVISKDGKEKMTYTINLIRETTGVVQPGKQVYVTVNDGQVNIFGLEADTPVRLYTLNGQLITHTTDTSISLPGDGRYIVVTTDKSFKICY